MTPQRVPGLHHRIWVNVSYSMAERGSKVLDGIKIVNELNSTQGDHHGLSAWALIILRVLKGGRVGWKKVGLTGRRS